MAEIQRKAQAGIKLVNPTADKMQAYNRFANTSSTSKPAQPQPKPQTATGISGINGIRNMPGAPNTNGMNNIRNMPGAPNTNGMNNIRNMPGAPNTNGMNNIKTMPGISQTSASKMLPSLTQNNSINSKTMAEIQRKASQGIALVKPTEEKMQAYNRFAGIGQGTMNEMQKSFEGARPQPNTPQPTYAFGSYQPGTSTIDPTWIEKAREYQISAGQNELFDGFVGNSANAGDLLDEDGLMELAYYLQESNNVSNQFSELSRKYMDQEFNNNRGLVNDWATKYDDLTEMAKKNYAYQDFLADKYGTNSQNDTTWTGLSRKDLGFNEGGDFTTLEERTANGIASDPWGINSSYFNDPRHKGQKFAYMDYFDPTAYASQRAQAEDGRGIEYWYNTNFARENGYEDDNWNYNGNNFADWRQLSHDQVVGKYGVGGTNWFGTDANLQQYKQLVSSIMNGTFQGGGSSGGSGGATTTPSSNTGKLNEQQKALAEAIKRYTGKQG